MKTILCIAFLSAWCCATVLSDAAGQATIGQWREVFTTNSSILGSNGSSNIPYTDDICYDPNSKRLYYIGGDHCVYAYFVSYDEATNAWERPPRPSWMPPASAYCNGMMHGYDHGAMDAGRGFYYHKWGKHFERYNTSTQTWSATPDWTFSDDYANCCDGAEYFPELDGVVLVNGNNGFAGCVYLYKESTNQWTKLASGLVAGSTYQYAEYNPVHKVMIFMVRSTWYKLTSAGQVENIAQPPFSVYNGSGYVGVVTVDPVSGLYLVLTPVTRQLYTYDVQADSWQAVSSPSKPNMSNKGVIATPLAAYGATLFTACGSTCNVYVYKHSATAVEKAALNSGRSELSVSPNPIRSVARVQWCGEEPSSVRVFDLRGREIASLSDNMEYGSAVWNTSAVPAGLYWIRADFGSTAASRAVAIVH